MVYPPLSRNLTRVCARCGLPPHYTFLRLVSQLVTALSRSVHSHSLYSSMHLTFPSLTVTVENTALTFVLAPAPNALAASCARGQDFSAEYDTTSPIVDFGRFMTSCVVVTGFALPIVLSHAQVIHPAASVMSLIGGGLVYVTITAYSAVFRQDEDEF